MYRKDQGKAYAEVQEFRRLGDDEEKNSRACT